MGRIFTDYSITDEYCSQPYIPHCNVTRAVRKAIGTYPPTATVQQFLEDDVERSDTRRVTQASFEYLCSLCEISGTMDATVEAQRAARAILRGRSSVPIDELREMLQQQQSRPSKGTLIEEDSSEDRCASNALTVQEFAKVIAELEREAPGPVGESIPASVVEHMLMGPSRHSSAAQSLHSTATFQATQGGGGDTRPLEEEEGGAPLHLTSSAESSQHDFPPLGGYSAAGVSIALSDPSVHGGSPGQQGLVPPGSHYSVTSDPVSDATVTPGASAANPPVPAPPPELLPAAARVAPQPAQAAPSTTARATPPPSKPPKEKKSGCACSVM